MLRRFLRDKKNLVILLLSTLFVIKIPQENPRFIFWIVIGVIIAASADILVKYFLSGQIIIPKSAIISGFIVSGIIDYRQNWPILIAFCLLAVSSKYLIKVKAKHIFNPANLALFLATLFGIPLTWQIASNNYLIVLVGLYLAYSYKKFPQVLGFVIIFSIFFGAQGITLFNLISWFFVFIMLIEPKTSGFGVLRGFIFGAITAIISFLMFSFVPRYDLFTASLFVANAFNPLLEKIKK